MATAELPAELLLNVYVIDLHGGFPIKILSSQTVGGLKNAVLEATPNSMKGIDAFQLTLYRVEYLNNGTIAHDWGHIPKLKLDVWNDVLSNVFPTQPPERTVNVLVEVPHVTTPASNEFYDASRKLYDAMWGKDLDSRLQDVSSDSDSDQGLKFLPATEVNSLQLQQLGCIVGAILIREEYRSIFDTLSKSKSLAKSGGTVVTGGSGIGKSTFLFYALLRLLSDKQPVALQKFGDIVLFHPNGVEIHNAGVPYLPSDFKGRFWALSDSSGEYRTPPLLFQALSGPNGRAWIVQTSSPAIYRWKSWSKQRGAALLIMRNFSEKESKALSSIFNYDTEAFLQNHRKWGGCARTCVELMTGILSENRLQCEAFGVARIFAENPDSISMQGNTDMPSHYVFTLSPDEDDKSVANFHVATPYLRDLVMTAIANSDAAKQVAFYTQASGHPHLKGTLGYIFEKYFYVWLSCDFNRENELSCTGKAKSGRSEADSFSLHPVGKNNVHISPPISFFKGVNSQLKRATSVAWIPTSPTQATFDAIIFTHDRIVSIQVTVADNHTINPKGFEEMKKYLPKKFQNTRMWCHVFITDRPSNVIRLQKHRYEVAEKMDISVYAAHLGVSALKLTSDDLERTEKVDDGVTTMDTGGIEIEVPGEQQVQEGEAGPSHSFEKRAKGKGKEVAATNVGDQDGVVATEEGGVEIEAPGEQHIQEGEAGPSQSFEERAKGKGKEVAATTRVTRQTTRKRLASAVEDEERSLRRDSGEKEPSEVQTEGSR